VLHTIVNFGYKNVGNHSVQRTDRKITSLHGLTRTLFSKQYSLFSEFFYRRK